MLHHLTVQSSLSWMPFKAHSAPYCHRVVRLETLRANSIPELSLFSFFWDEYAMILFVKYDEENKIKNAKQKGKKWWCGSITQVLLAVFVALRPTHVRRHVMHHPPPPMQDTCSHVFLTSSDQAPPFLLLFTLSFPPPPPPPSPCIHLYPTPTPTPPTPPHPALLT